MTLSKNRIKYINSLKLKKNRDSAGQIIIEGDKIIRDFLSKNDTKVSQLIATEEWLSGNGHLLQKKVAEITEADEQDMARISSLETPPPVLAVMDIQKTDLDLNNIVSGLNIGLDCVQDPGNMGTIIRTADWFGISNIICSRDSADCYNPKTIQSSMGAVMNVNVYYADLREVLKTVSEHKTNFHILGTFMVGESLYKMPALSSGVLMFGNEARGISKELDQFINHRITIPSPNNRQTRVESLNVASAVAIACSWLVKK